MHGTGMNGCIRVEMRGEGKLFMGHFDPMTRCWIILMMGEIWGWLTVEIIHFGALPVIRKINASL